MNYDFMHPPFDHSKKIPEDYNPEFKTGRLMLKNCGGFKRGDLIRVKKITLASGNPAITVTFVRNGRAMITKKGFVDLDGFYFLISKSKEFELDNLLEIDAIILTLLKIFRVEIKENPSEEDCREYEVC